MNDTAKGWAGGVGIVMVLILLCLICIFGGLGACGAIKNFHRGQALQNARNRVKITKIEIQNQDQQAQVVNAQNGIVAAKAQQRYIEAVGIRRAQDEISKTLTPLYIQHEAIQAQEAEAQKPNSTVVYVPSGAQGVPLVQNMPVPHGSSP